MTIDVNRLRANLEAVESRIQRACERAGRARSDVTLVAVTKSVSVEVAALLPELGITHLGESRPQELWRKAEALPKEIRWHLIGHLQRNKVERTLPIAHLIHAADSVRLLQAISAEATKRQQWAAVLLEVNASGEANKQGFAPADMGGIMAIARELPLVSVCGFMTMAALQEAEACRPTFATLRKLAEQFELEILSIGMSNDFEVAIEEGATLIRLGTVLFEGVQQ